MDNNEKKSNKPKVVAAVVAAIVVLAVMNNLSKRHTNMESAAENTLKELKDNTSEEGFENARKKIEDRSKAEFANMEGNQKIIAAAAGVLAMEYRYAEGYAQYCKDYGVALPNFTKHAFAVNKDVHDVAIKALEKVGMNKERVDNEIIIPLGGKFKEIIAIEIEDITKSDGSTPEQICQSLEATAEQNDAVNVSAQRPDIVETIEAFIAE